MLKHIQSCWVITDEAAGNQRQALALATALGVPARHLVLRPRPPWSWLAPRLQPGATLALPASQRQQFKPPWPGLAIGCGRRAALYTRLLRARSGGRCYTVQILDPRMDTVHWDTVIAPQHDEPMGLDVIRPLGSLHPVDATWLREARQAYPALAQLPGPRVGVLLGGPRRGVVVDEHYLKRLVERLVIRQRSEGGSLMVLASRRTPVDAMASLHVMLRDVPGLLWSGVPDGPNPYPGVLAWADRLVVTPESVNMLSEACAVGCPVHTWVTAPPPPKIARFHQSLRKAGLLHNLDAQVTTALHPPLRETGAVAAIVAQRIEAAAAPRRGHS